MEETFGARLKELRTEKELSLKDLSSILGISLATLSNYERNERKPDFDTLLRISNFFRVTTDYLLCSVDIRNIYETAYSITNKDFSNMINSLDIENSNVAYEILMQTQNSIMSLINLSDENIVSLMKDAYNSLYQIYVTSMCSVNIYPSSTWELYKTFYYHKDQLDATLKAYFECCAAKIEENKDDTNED